MCIKKIDVLCHSLISVYEQGKEKEWVLYIDHWFFFLHSVEFFENLLIHIRKEICLHFNEMMCKKLNWIVIIGWKPMCSMLNWFNDFLKKTLHCATLYSFPYWKSDFVSISKSSILSLLKRILFLTEKLLFQKHTKF